MRVQDSGVAKRRFGFGDQILKFIIGNPSSTKFSKSVLNLWKRRSLVLKADPQPQDELKKLVQERISSRGKVLTGFAMRFSGVFKDSQFVESDGSSGLGENDLSRA